MSSRARSPTRPGGRDQVHGSARVYAIKAWKYSFKSHITVYEPVWSIILSEKVWEYPGEQLELSIMMAASGKLHYPSITSSLILDQRPNLRYCTPVHQSRSAQDLSLIQMTKCQQCHLVDIHHQLEVAEGEVEQQRSNTGHNGHTHVR